jgi:hypothetical protein
VQPTPTNNGLDEAHGIGKSKCAISGANPTIMSNNASAVKIYNATSSLVRFENTNNFFFFGKTL